MGWLSSNKKDAPPPLLAKSDTNRTYPPPSTKAEPYLTSGSNAAEDKNYDGSMASYNSPSQNSSADYPSTNYPEDQFENQSSASYQTGPYNTGSATTAASNAENRWDNSPAAGAQRGSYEAAARNSAGIRSDNGQDAPWRTNADGPDRDNDYYGRSTSDELAYGRAGNESSQSRADAETPSSYGRDLQSNRYSAAPYVEGQASADRGYDESSRSRYSDMPAGRGAEPNWPRDDHYSRPQEGQEATGASQREGRTDATDTQNRSTSATARHDGNAPRMDDSWRPGSTTDYAASVPENREPNRGPESYSQYRSEVSASSRYDGGGRYDAPQRGNTVNDSQYAPEQSPSSAGYGNEPLDRYPQHISRGPDSTSRY
jgi:hypothetical protein